MGAVSIKRNPDGTITSTYPDGKKVTTGNSGTVQWNLNGVGGLTNAPQHGSSTRLTLGNNHLAHIPSSGYHQIIPGTYQQLNPHHFNMGKQMGEYTSITAPKYLYRCSYNGLTWLNVSSELRASSTDDEMICSEKQVKLDQFMEQMYLKFGTALPDAKELEFLWNVFITSDE